MKYQIFHTIEDSEKYCFSATVIEKKSKLFFTLKKHHLIQILLYGEHHPWNF